ncbi:MAG: hypothetical protein ABMA25_29415, partial [Ilumatobacteraceae bacterium]
MSDPNTTAVIVDAVRTPLGRRNGKLKDWHPVDLAGETLRALQQRTGIDPGIIDDVIMGCVMQVGAQSRHQPLAQQAALPIVDQLHSVQHRQRH